MAKKLYMEKEVRHRAPSLMREFKKSKSEALRKKKGSKADEFVSRQRNRGVDEKIIQRGLKVNNNFE